MNIQRTIVRFFYGMYVYTRALWSALGGPRHVCPFYPTCGSYVKESFATLPFFRALLVSVRRVASCHPWQSGSVDHPPKK